MDNKDTLKKRIMNRDEFFAKQFQKYCKRMIIQSINDLKISKFEESLKKGIK
jgi:hypothetical protein